MRVERVGDHGARRGVRLEQRMPEAVGGARGHRAALPGRQVVDDDLETGRSVVHVDDELVAVVELEGVGGDNGLIRRSPSSGRAGATGRPLFVTTA